MGFRIRIDEPGDHPRVVDVEQRIEVGRQVDGLRIFDPTVSRRHVALEARADGVVVTDLGSSYGTFVHGYRLAGAVLLQPGDVVSMGNSTLTVLGPTSAPAPGGAGPVPDAAAPIVGWGQHAGAESTVDALTLVGPSPLAAPVGLTPPPPSAGGANLTPPPPSVSPPPSVPAPPSTPMAPQTPAAGVGPVPAPAPAPPAVPAPAAVPAPPFARSLPAAALLVGVLTVLALALPVALFVTIRAAVGGDLATGEVAVRLVALGAALLVSVSGLLGLSAYRSMLYGWTGEPGSPSPAERDRRLVAFGMGPAWVLVLGVTGLVADPLSGVLSLVSMVVVIAVWALLASPPHPGDVDDVDPAPVPPRRSGPVAVAALALVGVVAIAAVGLVLSAYLGGDLDAGPAVIAFVVAIQAPLPLLGLLRPSSGLP